MTAFTYTPTTFGLMLNFALPKGCDMVVLCVNLTQHTPLTVLLPHQVYRQKLREILTKHPDARGFTLIPYRSADRIDVPLNAVK